MRSRISTIQNTVLIFSLFATSFVAAQNQGEPQKQEMSNSDLTAKPAKGILDYDTFLIDANLDKDQDKQWFINNITLFDCSDEDGGNYIKQIYYYRWRLLKDHLILTENGYTFTEFITGDFWRTNKPYYKKTYSTIIAPAGHIINESKWLKNQEYVKDFIDFFLEGDGRILEYSDWIGDAIYSYYTTSGDLDYVTGKLQPLINLWNIRHKKYFDENVGLFWLTTWQDAMEYNSTALKLKNTFTKTYRPTVNSYMYALAKAIENIALLSGNDAVAAEFSKNAASVKTAMENFMWSKNQQFFMEKVRDTNSVDLSREIIGYAPWYFNVPDDNKTYIAAWNNLNNSTDGFKGEFGIRTVEKSSAFYLYDYKPQHCQWNGISWPYTSSITLTAMANILNNYENKGAVNKELYYQELKRFTLQQYKNGEPYIAESFHPDDNVWACDIDERSEHYLHSSYIDLIISGLMGIRTSEAGQLIVNPQTPETWDHFCLEDLPYRGKSVTVVYDVRTSGNRYKLNGTNEIDNGLSVYVDGILQGHSPDLTKLTIKMTSANKPAPEGKVNFAISEYPAEGYNSNYPLITSSFLNGEVNPETNENIYAATNGKVYYYNKPTNRFTFIGSDNERDDVIIDLGIAKRINQVNLYLYEDDGNIKAPESYSIQYATEASPDSYIDVPNINKSTDTPAGNTVNTVLFDWVNARKIKISFKHHQTSRTGITNIYVLGYKYPTYEAEDTMSDSSTIKSSQFASSKKYITQTIHADNGIDFSEIQVQKSGNYTLRVRYSNGMDSASNQQLIVNGMATNISYPTTGGSDVFQNTLQIIYLNKGNNSIKLINDKKGSIGIDNISIMGMDTYNDDFEDTRTWAQSRGSVVARGWTPYSEGWEVNEARYLVSKGSGFKTLLSYKTNGNFTNYRNVQFSSNVMVKNEEGEAGLLFRVSNPSNGINAFKGYYAGIDKLNNCLTLVKSDGKDTTLIDKVPIRFETNKDYNLKIVASENTIKVFFNNSETPQIETIEETYHSGQVGLRATNSAAEFSNISSSEIYE